MGGVGQREAKHHYPRRVAARAHPGARFGRTDECRIDLRKPNGGKVIGEMDLAGEDGE